MIYVVLRSAELQLARIRQRVRDGGHDVPSTKVIERRARSFVELGWFAAHVDQLFVFDNSSGEPDLLAQNVPGGLMCWSRLPEDLREALMQSGLALLED